MNSIITAAAGNLIRRCEYVFFSTLEQPNGGPDTRALFNLLKLRAEILTHGPAALSSPFEAWLGTNTSSRKVCQIRSDPRVCLYYIDTASFEGLSLHGQVSEVLDTSVRTALWLDAWEMFYPGGRDGGDFTVLRFRPLTGRYYHGLQVTDLSAADLA